MLDTPTMRNIDWKKNLTPNFLHTILIACSWGSKPVRQQPPHPSPHLPASIFYFPPLLLWSSLWSPSAEWIRGAHEETEFTATLSPTLHPSQEMKATSGTALTTTVGCIWKSFQMNSFSLSSVSWKSKYNQNYQNSYMHPLHYHSQTLWQETFWSTFPPPTPFFFSFNHTLK